MLGVTFESAGTLAKPRFPAHSTALSYLPMQARADRSAVRQTMAVDRHGVLVPAATAPALTPTNKAEVA